MRHAIALTAAAVLACPAHALTTAHVDITNITAPVITGIDGSSRAAGGMTATLLAGESFGYTFDYTLTASDDGLGTSDSACGPFGCGGVDVFRGFTGHGAPIHIPFNGRELAVANFFFGNACPGQSQCAPWVDFSGTFDYAATVSDDLPQTVTKSGQGHATFSLRAGFGVASITATLPDLMRQEVAIGDVPVAQPVPEPATWLAMLAGLAALGCWATERRR